MVRGTARGSGTGRVVTLFGSPAARSRVGRTDAQFEASGEAAESLNVFVGLSNHNGRVSYGRFGATPWQRNPDCSAARSFPAWSCWRWSPSCLAVAWSGRRATISRFAMICAPARYHTFNNVLLPERPHAQLLLDTDTGAVSVLELSGVGDFDLCSVSPCATPMASTAWRAAGGASRMMNNRPATWSWG